MIAFPIRVNAEFVTEAVNEFLVEDIDDWIENIGRLVEMVKCVKILENKLRICKRL